MSIPYLPIRAAESLTERKVIESINSIIAGKIAAVDSVTLTAGAATTVVSDNRFESGMVPVFCPMSANAAGALAGMYVSARAEGGFTLTHANTGTTDRTFGYVRVG
jgi:hypothetical protein